MATVQQITAELSKLSVLYRQQVSPEELLVLIEQWEELCCCLTDEQLVAAVKEHCREGKFFPCPADVMEAHQVVKSRIKYVPATPLPEYRDPDGMRRSQLNAALIRYMLSLHPGSPLRHAILNEFSGPDAVAGLQRLQRIKEVLGDAYNGKGFAVDDELPRTARAAPVSSSTAVGSLFA